MVYNKINDFMSDNENINTREDKRKEDEILNTNIISFKMNKEDENYLKEYPVELTFQHLNEWPSEENHKPICSYWQYDQITYEGEWKQDGCHMIKTNKTHTTCSCNHLTHFAVLMDIHGIYEKVCF
jgi:latrophilin 3